MQSRLSTPYIYVIEQTGSSPGYDLHICNQNQTVLDLLLCPCRRIDLTILLLYKQFYMLYIVFSFYNYLNAHFWNNLIIIRERKRKTEMWQGLGFWQILGPGSQYQPGLEVLPQARACAATWEPVVPGRNGPATRGGGLQSRLGSPGWTPGTRGPYGRELVTLFPLVKLSDISSAYVKQNCCVCSVC